MINIGPKCCCDFNNKEFIYKFFISQMKILFSEMRLKIFIIKLEYNLKSSE
jgi:hypothetical protein